MSLNTITLVGHAGRDPEIRFFESGTVVSNFTLAVNKPGKDEAPDWFHLEIWGKQAQVAADYIRKGSLVGVVGRMTSEQWTDRNSGEMRSKAVVKVERLALLGSKAGNTQPTGSNNNSSDTSQPALAAGASDSGTSTAPSTVPTPATTALSPAGWAQPAATAAPSWSSQPISAEEVPF